jgi:hypothetical protein
MSPAPVDCAVWPKWRTTLNPSKLGLSRLGKDDMTRSSLQSSDNGGFDKLIGGYSEYHSSWNQRTDYGPTWQPELLRY